MLISCIINDFDDFLLYCSETLIESCWLILINQGCLISILIFIQIDLFCNSSLEVVEAAASCTSAANDNAYWHKFFDGHALVVTLEVATSKQRII